MIAVVPAVILAAAVAIAWAYPLTRSRHMEIQAELARRRADRAAALIAGESQASPATSE